MLFTVGVVGGSTLTVSVGSIIGVLLEAVPPMALHFMNDFIVATGTGKVHPPRLVTLLPQTLNLVTL
jgi:hypothetical protein